MWKNIFRRMLLMPLEREFGNVWVPYYTYHKIMQGLLDVFKFKSL